MQSSNVIEGMFVGHTEKEPALYPSFALLFYKSQQHQYGNESLVATSHPLKQYEGQPAPVIGAGHVMPDADLRELLLSMLDMTNDLEGFIPSDVLVCSTRKLAWYVKGGTRTLYFKPVGKSKPIRLTVPVPTLLFVATNNGLSLAALKTSRRPTENTPLFHAPFMNIYRDGGVCLGSARMPAPLSIKVRDKVEDCIFKTNFSHTNHEQTLKAEGNVSNAAHLRFWRGLHKDKCSTFPNASLAPMGKKVGDFL